jgi:DNA-binding beta-propeller fold protein YncE
LAGTTLVAPIRAVPPLVQLPGTAACVSETGSGGSCVNGIVLDAAWSLAISPDGRNVYLGTAEEVITVFDRDPGTGELTQKAGVPACISETGSGGLCADGVALAWPNHVTVSPDGNNVYAASGISSAVAVFDRGPSTGALAQKAGTDACVSETGTGGSCAIGRALAGASGVAVSPDGRHVYVASYVSDALATFERNVTTGQLTQKLLGGCVSEDGSGGQCDNGLALVGSTWATVSPDGRNVYVASHISDAVAVFDRNHANGVLTQKAGVSACVSETGTNGDCANGKALAGPLQAVVSPDGRNVYVVSYDSHAMAVFDRNLATGALSQKAGLAGCVSESGTGGTCTDGRGLDAAHHLAVSPDGRSVYVASAGGALAVFDRDPATGALSQKPG